MKADTADLPSLEVRRLAPDGTVHRFTSVNAAFSACGRLARSFAGPLVSSTRDRLCPHCWPKHAPPVAMIWFDGEPVDLTPPDAIAHAG